MAANLYRLDRSHPLAVELLACLQGISDNFAKLKNLRLAMIQDKDGATGTKTDYVTIAGLYGYLSATQQADDGTVALASFAEIDAFVSNGGPSLEQCCARHKQ
jgi:hypothetical protein